MHVARKSHSLGGFSNEQLKACARLATRWCGMMAEGCRSVVSVRKHERWWVGQELCTLPEKSHRAC